MSDSPELPITGGCNCGAVRFEISEPLLGAALCYCKRCQRRTGTAFSATALTSPGSFRLTAGESEIRDWSAGDGWTKWFCPTCGGHIQTTNPEDPTAVAVRMGSFDSDPGIRPMAHQFVNYAPDWWDIPDDGLPRFPERLGTTDPL